MVWNDVLWCDVMWCVPNTHSVFWELCIYLQCVLVRNLSGDHLVWKNDEVSHILFMNIIGHHLFFVTGSSILNCMMLWLVFFVSLHSSYLWRADRFSLIFTKYFLTKAFSNNACVEQMWKNVNMNENANHTDGWQVRMWFESILSSSCNINDLATD